MTGRSRIAATIVSSPPQFVADVPAVLVGDKLANKIPMKWGHSIAAAIFASLGVATLLGASSTLGL